MYFGCITGGEMIADKHRSVKSPSHEGFIGEFTREAIERDASHGVAEAIRRGGSRRPHCRSPVVDASVRAPYSLAAAYDRPSAWLDRMVVVGRGRAAGPSASCRAFALPLGTPQHAAPQLIVRVGAQKITLALDGRSWVYQQLGGPE
jgi:hypothetical protein